MNILHFLNFKSRFLVAGTSLFFGLLFTAPNKGYSQNQAEAAKAVVGMPSSEVTFTKINGKTIGSNGYFTFEVTGNGQKDAQLYKEEKLNFIKNHPDKYQEWNNKAKTNEKHVISKAEFEKMTQRMQERILATPEQYLIK